MKRAYTLIELVIVVTMMALIFWLMSMLFRGACTSIQQNHPSQVSDAGHMPKKRVYSQKVTTNQVTKTSSVQKSKSKELREKNAKVPVYHITLEFSQRSFTLNIAQHIRNAANAFEFTFPTTKEFYDSVEENQELASNFKTASFILGGHIGSRVITVKRKFIQWAPAPQKGD